MSDNAAEQTDDTAGASDPMLDSVNDIARLHARAEQRAGHHQRAIERLTAALGRPSSIWVLIAIMALWLAANSFGARLGLPRFDKPPFSWLQLIVGIASLLIATMILITENRQSRSAERRAHLDLQISLVTEQKITKLIALVEELRRDMPNVRDRTDLQAEAMQMPADPHIISSALESVIDDGGQREPSDPATDPDDARTGSGSDA